MRSPAANVRVEQEDEEEMCSYNWCVELWQYVCCFSCRFSNVLFERSGVVHLLETLHYIYRPHHNPNVPAPCIDSGTIVEVCVVWCDVTQHGVAQSDG